NATYFAQAVGYPLTMLLGHLPRPGNDVVEVLAVSGVCLAALLVLGRGNIASIGFGLLWFAAALLLPCLLLPWPNYVIDAPRLLYAASAGIALVCAGVLAPR